MRREALVVLAVAALVLGLLLPLAVNSLFRQQTGQRVPRAVPVYLPVETGDGSVTRRDQWFSGLGGLGVFKSYAELREFLKVVAGFRAVHGRTPGISLPVITPLVEILPLDSVVPRTEPVVSKPVLQETPVSKTNVQVEGVDEPDVVKTNGNIIVVAVGDGVYVVGTAEKSVLSVVRVEGSVKGLYLENGVLVVLAESKTKEGVVPRVDCNCFYIPPETPIVAVYVYSLEDPARPRLRGSVTVTGTMVSSRLRDRAVYLVSVLPVGGGDVVPLVNGEAVPLETLYAVDDKPDTYTTILALDLEKLEYAVYAFLTSSISWLYMSHENLYIAHDSRYTLEDAYEEALEVMARLLPEELSSNITRLVGEGRVLEALNLAGKYASLFSEEELQRFLAAVNEELGKRGGKPETVFYVFGVSGISIKPRGLFRVPGQLLDQFAMEEYRGRYFVVATTERLYMVRVDAARIAYIESPVYSENGAVRTTARTIRVATCTGGNCTIKRISIAAPVETPPKPLEPAVHFYVYLFSPPDTLNNVFVVDLDRLDVVGAVTGLAPGERVFAARLVKNVFFLVTARDVDPLFAVDVSTPENPVVLGYLKLPGFSEYLHPLPGDRLLGIGSEWWGDLKISLFDVSNPADMIEIAKIVVAPGWSPALQSHHAVTVYLERNLVFIPYSTASSVPTAGVLVVGFSESELVFEAVLEHPLAVRAVYIGDEVYTVSEYSIKVFMLPTYKEIAEIPLGPRFLTP